jgi:DNA-binding CsgD family transcriptional regulator
MTVKKPRGRPEFVPTDEDREKVQVLRAQGMSKEAIAEALGIHYQTLNTHFSMDMEVAVAKKTAEVMMARYRSAVGGSVPAQNKFLEMAGAIPPKPPKQAKAAKIGKKEAAQVEAEAKPDDTEWGTLVH